MPDEKTDNKNIFPEEKYGQQYIRFIEMTVHDLQAPLRKLGVLTGLLTDKYKALKDDEADQYIRRIHGCIDNMRSLIGGFTELAVAIPENMHYENCDPAQIIKKIVQDLTAHEKTKEAEISIGEIPVINADKAQLRALFTNLLENSFKFSRPGIPLKVTINSTVPTVDEKKQFPLDEKRSYCRISIEDNGIGFDPVDAATIFHPLVRLNGKSAYAGNGLGLALVKRIIDNHQGFVYAGGSREKGACIILIIPQNHD